MFTPDFTIRPATPQDISVILKLIRELADYEHAPNEVTNTQQQLEHDLFGENRVCEAIVADSSIGVIGFALYYTAYSTWKGPCLYLEDLCVTEKYRRKGIGKLLFEKVICIAKERQMKRLSWQVLQWNAPAIEFYKKYYAEFDSEWVNGKIRLD